MKRFISTSFFLLLGLSLYAQWTEVEEEINQQVWRLFIEAYQDFDTKKFMSIHDKELIRVIRSGKKIRGYKSYHQSMTDSNNRGKQKQTKKSISFSFTERFNNGQLASEKGYYKVIYKTEGAPDQIHYGEFDVILKKRGKKWRILLDSDVSAKGLSETKFLEGKIFE